MHIAVIPDGNRRFIKKTNNVSFDASVKAMRGLIDWCAKNESVYSLSVFCWSSENWRRAENEINAAMQCLYDYLHSIDPRLPGSPRYVCCSSSPMALPVHIREEMVRINNGYDGRDSPVCVYLYISYGFQEHWKVSGSDAKHPLHIHTMDVDIPPVDCLIRTSGEKRLSNFCMHKLGFSELVFVDCLFPECNDSTWNACMREFTQRDRRFGA